MDRLHIVYNPSSAKGRSIKKKKAIEACLAENNINYLIRITESEEDLKNIIREKIQSESSLVLVGGDTTFQIGVDLVLTLRKNTILGFIPTGSANDIVRGLGVPDIKSAVRAIGYGYTREVNVASLKISGRNGTTNFLGTLSTGLGTSVNRYVENFALKHPAVARINLFGQVFAGLLGIHNSFSRGKVPLRCTIEYNSKKIAVDFSLLVFLNTPYYANGLKLTDTCGLFNRVFSCVIIKTKNFRQTFKAGISAMRGRISELESFRILHSDRFRISFEEEVDIQVDGEIIRDVLEFDISYQPEAIRVYVPKNM